MGIPFSRLAVIIIAWTLQAPLAHAAARTTETKYSESASEATRTPYDKPLFYGHVKALQGISIKSGVLSKEAGAWKQLSNGTLLWEYPFSLPNALSLDFGFTDFYLPGSASLTIRSLADGQSIGPFFGKDYGKLGRFFSPIVAGGDAVIELRVSKTEISNVNLNLDSVTEGFLDVFKAVDPMQKSEGCQVDVACPAGLAVTPQSRAVAMFTARTGSEAFACTGALLAKANFYAHSDPVDPNFLTANHCISSPEEAATMVFYWGYQSDSCRLPGSRTNAIHVPRVAAHYLAHQPGGATLLANYARSDFALVHLNTDVPAAANAFWLGWDRRDQIAHGAFVIHHANSDEKRISMTYRDLAISGYLVAAGNHHLQIPSYAMGTTEMGSSGSPLMNDQGRVIGQLHGGTSDCASTSPGSDYYGRFATSWTGGEEPDTRLSDWLDPDNTNVEFISGMDANGQSEGGWFGVHGQVTDVSADCNSPIPDDPSEVVECPVTVEDLGGTGEVTFHILGSGLNSANLVASLESPTHHTYRAPPATFGVLSPEAAMFVARLGRIDETNGNWILRIHGREPASDGSNGQIASVRLFASLGASWWGWDTVTP